MNHLHPAYTHYYTKLQPESFERDPFFIQNPSEYLRYQKPCFLGITPAWHDFVQSILHERIAKNTHELQPLLHEDHQPIKAEKEPEVAQTHPSDNKELTHKVWTAEEQKLLFELTLEGKSLEEICHILDRTRKSVLRRLQLLKLMPFHAKRRSWPDQDFEELKSLEMGINDLRSVALRIKRTKPDCLRFLKLYTRNYRE